VLGDGVNKHDPNLLLQAGRCYKGCGDWENALKYLEQAQRFLREDANCLSLLADTRALTGEEIKAKALFREAFYRNPLAVDLTAMESGLILNLITQVTDLGYSGNALLEWLPVYGSVMGVFNVKHELNAREQRRLAQDIFALENEVNAAKAKPERRADLRIPRLLNKYIWLMDYYTASEEAENGAGAPGGKSAGLIEQTMLKIKLIAPEFYERYFV
jgi:tetratricopeptide (TPR) repeat protein